jgi:hypothetical protein
MVALKGHHRVPMVVQRLGYSEEGYRDFKAAQRVDMASLLQDSARGEVEYPKQDLAVVVWLDANAVPQERTYPLEILEELDDA